MRVSAALSPPGLWTRRRFGAVAAQALVLAGVAALLGLAAHNAALNLARLGIKTGFGFLWRPAGFAIGQSLIPYSEGSRYLDAFLVALVNTLVLAAVAIALATPIGFLVGIARRSSNGLVAGIAAAYVEVLRNLPLLLQLFFWYFAVLRPLPPPRQSLSILGIAFINARGLFLPAPIAEPGFAAVAAAFIVALVLAALAARSLKRKRATTGHAPRPWPIALGLVLGLPLLAAAAAGFPLHWDPPILTGFNFQGGLAVNPEFVAMTLALSLYSAAYIAEIVRAGLDAVPQGQVEAAHALGLRPAPVYLKIVVPQALRVIVPPLANEHLRILRNTTLAAAIAYPDLMLIFAGTVLNQTAQAFEVMTITLLTYLAISLSVAAVMNWYNRRIMPVGR